MDGQEGAFRAWRARILGTFLLFGILCGSWIARIPAIQQKLALSPGWLGLALASPSVGALLMSALMPRLETRWGSAALTRAGALGWTAILALPALAPGLPSLMAALFGFGVVSGMLNIAMNTQGQALATAWARPLMSSFHAFFGLGAMLGSSGAALAARFHISPAGHLGAATLALLPLAAWSTRGLLSPPRAAGAASAANQSGDNSGEGKPRLWGLSALAVCGLIGEGAMADWAGVYLRTAVGAGAGTAALGYAVFSASLTAARLVGDRLVARLGPARLVSGGWVLAGSVLAAALWWGGQNLAFAAFVAMGIGYAGSYPTITSVAARFTEPKPHVGIAAVAATAYVSFLGGPPLLGLAAEAVGLAGALGIVAALNLAGAAFAARVLPKR